MAYIHDPKERMLARVKALLALARDKGATPAEAAKAAESASRLALMHSIDLSNLEGGEKPEQYKPASVCGATEGYKAWKSNLVAGLALVNGCFAYTQQMPGGLCFYMVSGPEHVHEVIRLTVEYLEGAIGHHHHQAMASLRVRGERPSNPKAFRRAFYQQASRELYARLMRRRQDLETQQSPVVEPAPSDAPQIASAKTPGTALVPVGFYAEQERRAKDAVEADKMKTRSQPQSKNPSGRIFGAAAGRKIGLDRQVGREKMDNKQIGKE